MPLKTRRSPLVSPSTTPEASFAVGPAQAVVASASAPKRPANSSLVVFMWRPPGGRPFRRRPIAGANPTFARRVCRGRLGCDGFFDVGFALAQPGDLADQHGGRDRLADH